MDAIELAQFLRIVAVAVFALIACPVVVLLAERSDRRAQNERDRREYPTAMDLAASH